MTNKSPAARGAERQEEARQKAKFNTETDSVKPENQNRQHNVKKVSEGPNTKR